MSTATQQDNPPSPLAASQSDWAIIVRLLKLTWRYRWGCIRVLGLQMLLLIMGLSGLGLTGVGIDVIRYNVAGSQVAPPRWPFGLDPGAAWGLSPMAQLGVVSGLILTMALARSGLSRLYTVAMADVLQGKVVVQLRGQVYDKLQRLSFRFFDATATGSVINRVTGDVQNLRLFIDGVVMQTIILTISLGFYFVYMVGVHVPLTLACLSTTPLIFVLARRFSKVVQPAYRKEREMFDEIILDLAETIQGMHVVKGFAREQAQIERFQAANLRLANHKNWIFHQVTTYPQAIGYLTQLNLVVLLTYGGYLVMQGQLPLGTGMVAFAALLQQFSAQVQNLATVANSMQQALTGSRRVFEILDTPAEIQNVPDPQPLPRARGDVQFHHVTFGFTPGVPVLHDVHLDVPAGSCVALLGATGAGKTTLLSLIPRFYDVQSGHVRVDGTDVRRYDISDLRRNIGIVFQESFLFSTTIAQNISFGHPHASREQIERAARVAAAHDFIMELPDGYDTVLREGGGDLSGGQRQRLAIARAILLEPAILLLDDPTAAIDPGTEEEILTAMEQAMQGRTTFVVAHRLSTLRRADWIVVLDHGRIVQQGTHEELMNQRGLYRHAARLQVADDVSRNLLEL